MLHIFGNVLRDQWIFDILPHHQTAGGKENAELRAHHDLQMAEVRYYYVVRVASYDITATDCARKLNVFLFIVFPEYSRCTER